jgi:hypothetical protein
MEEGFTDGPERGNGRGRVDEGVVAGNEDGLIGYKVFEEDNGQVVVRVVVVSAGFAGESHTG